MATATVARSSNALRTRRDLPPKRTSAAMDGTTAEGSNKKRKFDEPYVITDDHILRKFRGKPPSLVVHLHPNYFKFNGDGSFAYDSSMRVFLESLRKQHVPHDMLEELFAEGIPFYDGCLIVEVHNHRSANGKDKAKQDSTAPGGQTKYSMHNYNSYVTPSGFGPYPKKAKEDAADEKATSSDAKEQNKSAEDKDKKKEKDNDGPRITTIVLHPTPLSQRREMLILANTPASELRSKKKSTDGGSSTGQPSTPQLSVPPTPLGAPGQSGQSSKMVVEPENFYQFEADLLLATQPPLLLEPARTSREADNALRLLEHPLHREPPPSPKTRKRTTAEMAADDAHAAEAERRMLIMDERIKPAAPGASDTAGAAQAMGFSRFKTIQMVREKHEEQERQKKEEEAQAALQRRQQEEAEKLAQQKALAQNEKQKQILQQRQRLASQQQQDLRNQQMAGAQAQLQAQQAAMVQGHSHPQQNNWNQQQASFQHQSSRAQSSPVVRQQTPMMNSSPMLGQNGFPMATTSQGAGSPPRPTSAMPNPNLAMARQVSQQQLGSRNATPQMASGTPHLAGAMPSRQVSQTPRMSHASPAPGTPAAINMPQMPLQTPQGMNPAQMAMLQHQMQSQGGMNASSPGQNSTMTPEQIQNINAQQQRARQQMMMAQNPQLQQIMAQRQTMMLRQQQQQQQMLHQQRMMQQQNANGGQAGSPMQGTPQMGHGHPQQGGGNEQQMAAQQRQQMILKQAQAQLQQVVHTYGGFNAIPQNIAQSLPQPAQMLLRQQLQRQNAQRAQQMAMRAQAAQSAGQPVAGSSHGDPEYMATLRNHQAMLAAQQQAQHSSQGGAGMNMNNLNFGNQQFGGHGQNDLSQSFAAMHNALQRGDGMSQ